jgi:hypothetical protein
VKHAWVSRLAGPPDPETPESQLNAAADLKDITVRSSQMPPDSAILYPRNPGEGDAAHYIGVAKITRPGKFWVSAWYRTVNGKTVVELRLREAK